MPEYVESIHTDDRALFQGAVDQAIRTERRFEMAFRIVTADGPKRVISDGAPEFDEAGRVVRLTGTTREWSGDSIASEPARTRPLQNDSAADLTTVHKLEQTLDQILTNLARVVPYDQASVLLIEAGAARIVRAAGRQAPASPDMISVRRPIQQTPHLLRAATTGRFVVIPDTKTELGLDNLADGSWVRSRVTVPLVVDEETIGFLTVENASPGAFEPDQLGHIEASASQVAMTLENARLLTGSRRSVRELAALNRIQASINSTLELEWVLQLTMQEVQDLFGVEKCSLMLLDEQTNELFFQVALGSLADRQIRFNVNQGIAGWVVRSGQPALVNDVRADPRWYAEPDSVTGFTTRSIMAHPRKTRDKVLGVIELINKIDGTFNARQMELLDSISNSVAGAIENARLFGELNKAYQEMARTQGLIVESRNTLRTLVDGIDDTILIVDRDLRTVALNRAAAAQVGLDPRLAVGKFCYEILDRSDRPCSECPVNVTLDTRKPTLINRSRTGPDGKPRDFELRTYPLENQDGGVDRVIEIARDVTEQRKMEATLVQSAKLAAVGELAAGVAHEINNPLTAVYGNAQMLLRALEPDDPRYQMAELIERTGLRASKVVRNLLDFSRQEDYQFVPLDLNATIEDALALIVHQLQRNHIRVTKNLCDDLPPVNASASHLQTIWTNLLINARDAMGEQAEGDIQITTRIGEDGQSVLASFTDDGPGIAERDLARIFEPFFTTKPRGRGSGLGLYVSYMIVAHHNGTMQVTSQLGQGTTFIVSLPIAAE
ncbi:MAG: GAF domain-containing protein [Chloroflexi bacterium]|nr:GAF domain-containing protein [Chloroflexota bacterium]